jgi:hypothetical protein
LAARVTAATPDFACFVSHGFKRGVGAKLRYRSRQIFIESITAFLLDFTCLRWVFVTMTVIKSGFFHGYM